MVEKRLGESVRRNLLFGWWIPFVTGMVVLLGVTLLLVREHTLRNDQIVATSHLPVLEQQIATGDFVALDRSLKSLYRSLHWQKASVIAETGRVLSQMPDSGMRGAPMVYAPAHRRQCDHSLAIRNAAGSAIGTLCWRDAGWHDVLAILPMLLGLFAAATALQFVAWRKASQNLEREVARVRETTRQIAHDIASPLNVVSVGLEKIVSPQKESMLHAIGRLRAIAGELIGKSPVKEPWRVERLLDEVLKEKQTEYSLHSRIQFLREGQSKKTARVEATEIQRAISNIINNSVQALGHAGGTVHLKCIDEEKDVVIVVEDDGPGMDPAIQASIVEGRSIGRGLPHARRTVEACGGRLTIRSIPRLGTSVEIRLPAV